MNDWIANLTEQLRSLPPGRQLTLAAVATGSLGFFFWLANDVGTPDYRALFRGLADQETARVADALRAENIPYRLEDGGTGISVPAEQIHEARIRIAGRGLPGGSSSGFEIFDKPAFGVTDFVHRVNYARAVQGELARSIEQLDPVERARVQVVMPERKSVLAASTRKPSAAVVVKLAPGRELESAQVRAIVHLVASSIESLAQGDVTVVDGAGHLLAPQGDVSPGTLPPGGAPEHQKRVENELAQRIQTILEPVVGTGGVVARVRVDMDWTESEVTEERFDPNSQVARSETRTDEFESDPVDGGRPGITANGTGEGGSEEGAVGSKRSSETLNYEISKTVSRSLTAMGSVKRLSIAVLLDSSQSGGEGEGSEKSEESTWPPEAIERFEQLARQAVGFDEERGDQIVVSSAPFRAPEIQTLEEGFTIDPEWMIFGAQALRILAQLLALVLFARFIVKPFLGAMKETAARASIGLPASVSALEAQLEGGVMPPGLQVPKAPLSLAEQVSQEAHARTEDSVTTIRTWLNQG